MAIEIEAPQRAKGMVHKLIADTAKGMAAEHYEVLARDNRFFKAYPKLGPFVRKKWELYIPLAKQTLIGMLGSPTVSDEHKAVIHEAVLRDGAINPKRMATPEKPRFFLK